jgi:hypothetical protein
LTEWLTIRATEGDKMCHEDGKILWEGDRMRRAPLVERYTGPVLFEGQAAAEIFLQGLGSYMVGAPRVVVDDSCLERVYNSNAGLIDRVGTRVLPDFLTVIDNPALKEVSGKPLFGGYQVDDDGVKSAPTTIVDQGVLKTLLHTRGLLPSTAHSTASHRGFTASPSNLILTSSKSLTSEQLQAELIKIAQQHGKEYGILVRRMSNMAFASSLLRSRMIIVLLGVVDVDCQDDALSALPWPLSLFRSSRIPSCRVRTASQDKHVASGWTPAHLTKRASSVETLRRTPL